jgi:hypothetical protein
MGVANIAPFGEILLELAAAYRLPVRLIDGEEVRPNFDIGTDGSRAAAMKRGVLASDRFVFQWPVDTRDLLMEHIAKLKPGVTEFCAHPVADGPELHAYDPDAPELRARDAIYLCDPALKRLIADSGARPISFRPIRDLQRA